MNWYYVDGGQQAGPVDDAQLEELARSGKVTPQTLVWREGMPSWISYHDAKPNNLRMAVPPAPTTAEAVCTQCGRIYPKQNMITYGGVQVCADCKPAFVQKLAEGAQLNLGTLHYAGFWIRVLAKLIDGLILGAIFIVPVLIFAFRAAASGQQPTTQMQVMQLVVQLVYIFANMVYTIFFLGKYGATPGKMACKLVVVTAEGGKISYGRATGRFFAEMLSGIICYIGYIIVAFDKEKRALHDHICNTRVIYKQQ